MKLKLIIAKNGYRHDWIAENILGISKQCFSHRITGRSRFTEDEQQKLAEFFGIPVEELFGEADPVMN